MRKTAKPGARRTKRATRARYDWARAERLAAKGKIPPSLDFSAPTHARFVGVLKTVRAIATARGAGAQMRIDDLRKVKIKPISSSRIALARYRDLCVTALQKQAA